MLHIARYIRQDNPARAETFVAELEERCARLATTPYAYPLIPGREHSGIRRRLHRDYLIFYRVRPETDLIEVLYIINGAQDYEEILFPED
ncbi:type II toxin-antitoxin system RelE/ParE family toxin [Methylobacterium terricola]|uniref:type II toxin-antitoxin system RelE/ParE family toxin n=1 Tax=Methylobacterium terricola TaxID=2583531 RepID=UPI001FECC703|nr:type II toxin-antitoxin system RelE/ParE family toxin [Methylobacterium terricola]